MCSSDLLVGMVSMTAQWWLDEREPAKEVVAAHVVNLCWNGLSDLETSPKLGTQKLIDATPKSDQLDQLDQTEV